MNSMGNHGAVGGGGGGYPQNAGTLFVLVVFCSIS